MRAKWERRVGVKKFKDFFLRILSLSGQSEVQTNVGTFVLNVGKVRCPDSKFLKVNGTLASEI